MKISILHPSRSRPKRAYETAKKWIEKAGCEVQYILSLDENDSFRKQYLENFEVDVSQWESIYKVLLTRPEFPNADIIINANRSAVDAINNAAKVATGDILIVLSDDFDCCDNWGTQIIEATQGKTDWILKTPDGIQKWIITMPIMDRAYYNRFGYIYFPDYAHLFCDTEITCVADLTGRKLEANINFRHNHYSIGAGEKDAVSAKADATWAQGEKLFIERYKKNFGLIDPPGRIQSQEYLNWIKGKL